MCKARARNVGQPSPSSAFEDGAVVADGEEGPVEVEPDGEVGHTEQRSVSAKSVSCVVRTRPAGSVAVDGWLSRSEYEGLT